MATPRIQTPDYQGYADRVTPALDRLLMGYQEIKQRQAEEREFARRKLMLKEQQNFQQSMQKQQQQFRAGLQQQQQEFRRELSDDQYERELAMAEDEREFKRGLQFDLLDARTEDQMEINEDRFENQKEIAKLEHGFNMTEIGARNTGQASVTKAQTISDIKEGLDEDFNENFADLVDEAGMQVQTYVNENGQPMVTVAGSGFGTEEGAEEMTYDEFKQRTRLHRQIYDKMQEADQLKTQGKVRRVNSENGSPYVEEDNFRLYSYEEYKENLNKKLRNGPSDGDPFIEGVIDERFILDDTGVTAPETIDYERARFNLLSTPMEIEIDSGEFRMFDFENMTYGTIMDRYENLREELMTVEIESRGTENEYRAKNADQIKRLDQKINNYHALITDSASEAGITDVETVRNLKLNSGNIVKEDLSTFILQPNQSNNTSTQSNSPYNPYN